MIITGVFNAMEGVVALARNEVYVATPRYLFAFDLTTWGWIQVILGIVVVVAGVGVITGQLWGRVVGITIAALTMLANFAFIPYYPIWSLLIIALNVFVIWALCVYNRDSPPPQPLIAGPNLNTVAGPSRTTVSKQPGATGALSVDSRYTKAVTPSVFGDWGSAGRLVFEQEQPGTTSLRASGAEGRCCRSGERAACAPYRRLSVATTSLSVSTRPAESRACQGGRSRGSAAPAPAGP